MTANVAQSRKLTARKHEHGKAERNLRTSRVSNSGSTQTSPARFESFKLLHKEGFQLLGTLEEGRVIGVVIAAVVKYFGHVGHELCELVVMSLLQTGFHCGKVYEGGGRNVLSICTKYHGKHKLQQQEVDTLDFVYHQHHHYTLRSSNSSPTAIMCSYPLAPWSRDNNQARHGDPPAQGKAMPSCESV